MNDNIKKIGVLVLIVIVLRVLLVFSLNYINTHTSYYIFLKNNEVVLNNKLDKHLYTITDKAADNEKGNRTFFIKSDTNQEFVIIINNLTFMHEIYVNNSTVSQNIDENAPSYNSDYAYKSIEINSSDYNNGLVKISIKGNNAYKTDIFIAVSDIAKDSVEIRTIINVLIFIIFIISTLISYALFYYNKKDIYYFIFSVIGLVSLIKTIILGEIFVLSRLLGITAHNFSFLDNLTSIINTILPIFIVCYLFDYKIKFKTVISLFIAFIVIGLSIYLKGGIFLQFYNTVFLITFTIGNIIMILGYLKEKPYSRVILLNGVIYSSCTFYYLLVLRNKFLSGNILFFINPPYIGAVIYIVVFLFAMFFKHLEKVKLLENNKNEYDRIMLLRGISHDLKLPLSVIKLNNQIIEKYKLSGEEIREYAKTSLEAAFELEEMTENINSYLSIKQINNTNETASIKECFEKLKNHYKVQNINNSRFIVESDEKDCILKIDSLHLSRMLYNLIDNAFKFNKDDVIVSAKYMIDKKLYIIIEDNGIGMKEDEIYRVFEPFYRADQSRTVSGMGLGLNVVKNIVESLEGTIMVESIKNAGTKITIEIPIH